MKLIYKENLKLEDNDIILHTIKNQKEIDQLFNNKILTPNNEIIKKEWKDWPPFLDAYKWMNDKCKEKIENYNQKYPLWAWYKRPNANSFKIEFKGETFYIISFKINKHQCLISDFEKWHFVLNDIYLPENLNEEYDDDNDFDLQNIS